MLPLGSDRVGCDRGFLVTAPSMDSGHLISISISKLTSNKLSKLIIIMLLVSLQVTMLKVIKSAPY